MGIIIFPVRICLYNIPLTEAVEAETCANAGKINDLVKKLLL